MTSRDVDFDDPVKEVLRKEVHVVANIYEEGSFRATHLDSNWRWKWKAVVAHLDSNTWSMLVGEMLLSLNVMRKGLIMRFLIFKTEAYYHFSKYKRNAKLGCVIFDKVTKIIDATWERGYKLRMCKQDLRWLMGDVNVDQWIFFWLILEGLGLERKEDGFGDCFSSTMLHFFGLQVTKMTRLELFKLKATWISYRFDFSWNSASSLLGEIFSSWDTTCFAKSYVMWWKLCNFTRWVVQ